MSARGVVVSMVLAVVAGLALIFVAWPAWGSPWELVGTTLMAATHGARRPVVVVGLAGLAAAAVLVAIVWLSRRGADGRPG